jgi:hypothetical protein
MPITLVPRTTPLLSRAASETPRRVAPAVPAAPARGFQVLQSRRAPAQLCLFLRSSAADVK